VVPLHQEQEDQYGQAEPIVLCRTVHAGKVLTLQLGWGELRRPDWASIQTAGLISDLEGVDIDHGNKCPRRDEDVGGFEVADDVAARVKSVYGSGEVARRAVQVT
jgi:hypothetical protein